jgi:hypothetical protein
MYSGRILTAALFALLALPLNSSAQSAAPVKLAAGTWTGTVITPGNQDPTNVTFEVGYKGDTLQVALVVGEHGTFDLKELEVTETKISFSFTPGPKVVCVLKPQESGYAGECLDDQGGVAPLTMVPPAKPKS